MIAKDEAISKYLEAFPDRLIDEIFETPDLWIISGKDRETGEELDVSPASIRKIDGKMEEYFPPLHDGSLQANEIE